LSKKKPTGVHDSLRLLKIPGCPSEKDYGILHKFANWPLSIMASYKHGLASSLSPLHQ